MGPSRAIGSSCLAGETFLLRVWKVELAHPRTRIGPGPEWPSSEASSGLPGTLGLREASAGRQAVRIRSAVLEGGQPAATFSQDFAHQLPGFPGEDSGRAREKAPKASPRYLSSRDGAYKPSSGPAHLPGRRAGEADARSSGMPLPMPARSRRRLQSPYS